MFEARFQSFEDRTDRMAGAARVTALRGELARRGVDGFLVPRTDRHQNEYVPASEQRLAWLTGFDGSAGTALVLPDRAVLFTDGRYMLQVREQVDTSVFQIEHMVDTPVPAWIEANLPAGTRLGYDPWLFTAPFWCRPSRIRSTRSGRIGRRRRCVRWSCTNCAMPVRPCRRN
jgi:Xaa-Pro aminopeptidase